MNDRLSKLLRALSAFYSWFRYAIVTRKRKYPNSLSQLTWQQEKFIPQMTHPVAPGLDEGAHREFGEDTTACALIGAA